MSFKYIKKRRGLRIDSWWTWWYRFLVVVASTMTRRHITQAISLNKLIPGNHFAYPLGERCTIHKFLGFHYFAILLSCTFVFSSSAPSVLGLAASLKEKQMSNKKTTGTSPFLLSIIGCEAYAVNKFLPRCPMKVSNEASPFGLPSVADPSS